TLVRYNMARRRQIYSQSIPLEKADIQGSVNEPCRSELSIPVDETYNNFVNSLSHVELIALLTIIGEISTEYAIDHLNIEAMKLVRARARTLQKMRKVLF
ncbi:sigma-70 family RNA polymerase sigma factor, partial [Lactobacillus crispatus]